MFVEGLVDPIVDPPSSLDERPELNVELSFTEVLSVLSVSLAIVEATEAGPGLTFFELSLVLNPDLMITMLQQGCAACQSVRAKLRR